MDSVALRYAKALFELANEEDNVINYQNEARLVSSIVKENGELIDFLKSYVVKDEDKKSLLSKIFKDSVNLNILYFLYLLVDKKRVSYLKSILEEFNSLCNENRGIEEGIVYSTSSLTDERIKEIEEKVSQEINKKVELINKLDPSLIGGVKIVVKDTVFDNSVAYKMQALKSELTNGKDAK